MSEELDRTCRDCGNVKTIYYCKALAAEIENEKKLVECPYSHNWQRGNALYIWYCPECGNQLLAMTPPEKCPECNATLGRENVK